MKRRVFLKTLTAASALVSSAFSVGLPSFDAAQKEVFLVDDKSVKLRSVAGKNLVRVDFLGDFVSNSNLINLFLAQNVKIHGCLSVANGVVLAAVTNLEVGDLTADFVVF